MRDNDLARLETVIGRAVLVATAIGAACALTAIYLLSPGTL